MSRWDLLKKALTGDTSKETNLSIHRFNGHSTLVKKKIIWPGYQIIYEIKDSSDTNLLVLLTNLIHNYFTRCDCAEIKLIILTIDVFALLDILSSWDNTDILIDYTAISEESKVMIHAKSKEYQPIFRQVQYFSYLLPNSNINIFTRENAPKTKKYSPQEIFSHQIFKVDNTGNVCVWFSEPIFLKLLLIDESLRSIIEGKKVLELGGGMTGLIGLGLAASGLSTDICITDGHPHCVVNQNSCIEMCKSKGSIPEKTNITSELLEWSNPPSNIIQNTFDIILGADVLFFKDFHDALIQLLLLLLKPHSMAIFFQPKRSNSLSIFVEKCQKTGLKVEVNEDYNIEMTNEKELFKETFSEYDPDIHYPILLKISRPE